MALSLMFLASLSLGVAEPIARAPFNLTVVASLEGVISCEALGFPAPTITWSHGGHQSLTGGPVLRTHEPGVYVCDASNSHGTAKAVIRQQLDFIECSLCSGFVGAIVFLGVLLAGLVIGLYRWNRRAIGTPDLTREQPLLPRSV